MNEHKTKRTANWTTAWTQVKQRDAKALRKKSPRDTLLLLGMNPIKLLSPA